MARIKPVQVRIIIEGGGPGKQADSAFREGYRKFIDKIVASVIGELPVALEIVRGEGRGKAHRKFSHQKSLHPEALVLLLIDSDDGYSAGDPIWAFLERRDHVKKPTWAREDHVYLMVDCVETWIVADLEALKSHYGQSFNSGALPKQNDLEKVPHSELQSKLEQATRKCRRTYSHGDSAELIAKVTPGRIAHLSSASRFITGLPGAIEKFVREHLATGGPVEPA